MGLGRLIGFLGLSDAPEITAIMYHPFSFSNIYWRY
jgi:hypothetical protein